MPQSHSYYDTISVILISQLQREIEKGVAYALSRTLFKFEDICAFFRILPAQLRVGGKYHEKYIQIGYPCSHPLGDNNLESKWTKWEKLV